MLEPYRRHSEECESELQKKGFKPTEIDRHKRCDCPVWMRGRDRANQYVRESCKTRDWTYAGQVIAERFHRSGEEEQKKARVAIQDAQKRFLDEKLKKRFGTQKVYKLVTTKLIESARVRFIDEVTSDHAISFRNGLRTEAKRSRTINLYRACLHNWFGYCVRQDWMTVNPMDRVPCEDMEDDGEEPTLPLDDHGDANWRRIQAEIIPFLERRKTVQDRGIARYPQSFLALLEFLYHTGLRISDAIHFRPSEIETTEFGGSWTVKQQKTRARVTVFMEPWLAERLRALPPLTPEGHVFYGGGDWQAYINHHIRRPLRALGKHLGFPQSLRAHRFRDSFAVNALNDGVSLDDLKDLLGHKSLRTTERHYLKYTKNRQNALERRLYGVRSQMTTQDEKFLRAMKISTEDAA